MNMWMKRGLQAALLTGGLMALGTGIAAADDSGITVNVEVAETVRSGKPAPSPIPVIPADAPSWTAAAGTSSLDQPAADLAALAAVRGPATCPTAAGADGAVGSLPLDPSFSPD